MIQIPFFSQRKSSLCLQVLQVLSFTFSSQSNFCPHLKHYFVTSFPAKSCLQDGQRYIVVYPVLHSISGFFGVLSQPGFKWFHSSFASLVQGKSLLVQWHALHWRNIFPFIASQTLMSFLPHFGHFFCIFHHPQSCNPLSFPLIPLCIAVVRPLIP